MAKKKKISVNAIEEVVGKFGKNNTIEIEWEGLNIDIQPMLSLEDTMGFVDDVVSLTYEEDTGNYYPEIKDFLISCGVLERYTNLTLPKSIEHRFELVYKCDELIGIILGKVNEPQFHTIIDAIDEKIAYMARTHGNAVNRQAEELVQTMSALKDNLGDIMSGVTSEDIAKITEAIVNGKFDEARLVEAYWNKRDQEREQKLSPEEEASLGRPKHESEDND